MNQDKVKQFLSASRDLIKLSSELGYGDPFASYRIREIMLSIHLNHVLAKTLHFEDARNENDEKVEYKTSVIQKSKSVSQSLTGRYEISWQETWEKQKEYMLNEKIANNVYHYFALFCDATYRILEIRRMTGMQAYNLLLPKIKDKYVKRYTTKSKDGTLHASLSAKEIRNNSEKVYYWLDDPESFFTD